MMAVAGILIWTAGMLTGWHGSAPDIIGSICLTFGGACLYAHATWGE